jgi:hypothetical protein
VTQFIRAALRRADHDSRSGEQSRAFPRHRMVGVSIERPSRPSDKPSFGSGTDVTITSIAHQIRDIVGGRSRSSSTSPRTGRAPLL